MDILYTILGIAIVVLLFFVVLALAKVNENQEKTTNKLSSMHNSEGQTSGTILLPVIKLDPKAECSTVLPLPIGAEMCAHKMEVIVKEIIRAPHEERAIIICECTKCGVIDKTIAVTSAPPKPPLPPPLPPPPRAECRHRWVKEKSVTLQSAFEQMEEILKQRNGKSKTTKVTYDPKKKTTEEPEQQEAVFDPTNAPSWMFKKKYIQSKTCELCGEIDRAVVSNFEEGEEVEN